MSYNKRRRSSIGTNSFYGTAARLAYNYMNSGTQTQTMVKQNNAANSNQHTAVGSTSCVVTLNAKKPQHLKGQLRIYDGRSKLLKNRAGLQERMILNVIGSKSAWLNVTPAGSVTDDTMGNYPLMSIDPNANNSGSPLITASQADANQQQAMVLSNVQLTYDMTNTSTTANYVWLYFLSPKIATSKSPITDWGEATADVDYGAAAPAFPTGGNTDMAAASISTNQVGIRPDQFRLFTRKWNILKVKKVELASGASEKVQVQIRTNYIARRDVLEDTDDIYLPKKTVICMAIQHGSVCVDTTLNASGVATYSESQTAICSQLKYLLHPAKSKGNKLDFAVGASRIPIDAASTAQKIVDTKDAIVSVLGASN